MNYKYILIAKLKNYKKEDIIISRHAEEQALFRGVSISEVKENIINPERLRFAIRQKARKENEEKYNCYFGYSKTRCHRYVLILNRQCIVCTIIKINRRWQHLVEKHAKI